MKKAHLLQYSQIRARITFSRDGTYIDEHTLMVYVSLRDRLLAKASAASNQKGKRIKRSVTPD